MTIKNNDTLKTAPFPLIILFIFIPPLSLLPIYSLFIMTLKTKGAAVVSDHQEHVLFIGPVVRYVRVVTGRTFHPVVCQGHPSLQGGAHTGYRLQARIAGVIIQKPYRMVILEIAAAGRAVVARTDRVAYVQSPEIRVAGSEITELVFGKRTNGQGLGIIIRIVQQHIHGPYAVMAAQA